MCVTAWHWFTTKVCWRLSGCHLKGRDLWHNSSCGLQLWGTTSLTFRRGMWEYRVFPKAISLLGLCRRQVNKPEQGRWVLRSQVGLGLGQRVGPGDGSGSWPKSSGRNEEQTFSECWRRHRATRCHYYHPSACVLNGVVMDMGSRAQISYLAYWTLCFQGNCLWAAGGLAKAWALSSAASWSGQGPYRHESNAFPLSTPRDGLPISKGRHSLNTGVTPKEE